MNAVALGRNRLTTMMFNKMKFIAINLVIVLMVFYSDCSDTSQTIDARIAGWWKVNNKADIPKVLIQSIEGNYNVKKYWEMGYGGSDSLTYSVLRTSDSLDTYWQELMKRVNLEKPTVDFTKNILLIVQPGVGNIKFKYRISLIETHDSIELNVSNYLFGSRFGLSGSLFPIFAFEIPTPPISKTINVHFDIDSRSYGIQPK